ncbi:hypothetical protein LMG28688_06374 [Paraburkholderia caffeinitolerans]|uniref:Rieske domain-containing protein n=1 Tax=Paraburkholderia caffeinitolerans TaxID=1723730 RepID=A0A6J5GW36_9BURK|nr:Rieske (2Fe-2S) protein [Paraburkholderia caffeinitolerans]CAB3806486.1 hypothetical protein LMG28688_06374 [Paraburkholderia caffeinitolerans]
MSNSDQLACERAWLCNLHDLPDGGARGFDPCETGRDTIFVVRRNGELRGYVDSCPHHPGAPMAWRKDAWLNARGTHIVCHGHGAQFDILTGACVLGPCLGQALTPVVLHVASGDEIWVRLSSPWEP